MTSLRMMRLTMPERKREGTYTVCVLSQQQNEYACRIEDPEHGRYSARYLVEVWFYDAELLALHLLGEPGRIFVGVSLAYIISIATHVICFRSSGLFTLVIFSLFLSYHYHPTMYYSSWTYTMYSGPNSPYYIYCGCLSSLSR